MPKVGEVVSIKKLIGDINTDDQGTIIAIESERPYPYIVKVKDTQLISKPYNTSKMMQD